MIQTDKYQEAESQEWYAMPDVAQFSILYLSYSSQKNGFHADRICKY